MSKLKAGWAEAVFPDLIFFQEGPGLRKFQYRDSGFPFLNIRTFVEGRIEKSLCKFISIEEAEEKYRHFFVNEGDILVAISGSIGKMAVAHKEDLPVMLNTSVMRFRPLDPENITYPFLRYFLSSAGFQEQAWAVSTGSAQSNVGPSHIQNFRIPLPPLSEQRRIVAKLDALDASSKRARADLDRIPALVARAKQAILEKAFYAFGKQDSKPLQALTTKIGSGATPRGGKDVYKNEGVPFIRSQNIRFEGFRSEGLAYIDNVAAHDLRGVETKFGDVLFNITGASIGRVCTLPDTMIGARVSQHVAIIRPADGLSSQFLALYLQTPAIQKWVWEENYGVTRQALTKSMIERICIPTLTLSQQQNIVRRIESAFAKIDRIAAEAASASKLLDRLDQALLSKAFRGELVQQDPDDEPASELLARIQSARAAAPKAKRTRKTKEKTP